MSRKILVYPLLGVFLLSATLLSSCKEHKPSSNLASITVGIPESIAGDVQSYSLKSETKSSDSSCKVDDVKEEVKVVDGKTVVQPINIQLKKDCFPYTFTLGCYCSSTDGKLCYEGSETAPKPDSNEVKVKIVLKKQDPNANGPDKVEVESGKVNVTVIGTIATTVRDFFTSTCRSSMTKVESKNGYLFVNVPGLDCLQTPPGFNKNEGSAPSTITCPTGMYIFGIDTTSTEVEEALKQTVTHNLNIIDCTNKKQYNYVQK